jgi:hypothetical protein
MEIVISEEKTVSMPEQVEQILHIDEEISDKIVVEEGVETLEGGTVKKK